MAASHLTLLFFFGIASLWSVDGNNETSGLKTDDQQNQFDIEFPDQVLEFLCSPWLTRFIPSVYTVVLVLSLPFNMAAIFTFLFKIQVKTPPVVFMLNLAVSDVLFTILLPFNIVYRFSGNNWVIGEGMCRFVTAEFYCNMYCSILLMTSISVDRLLTVVYPFESLRWRTVKRTWQVCLVIWMVSIAGATPLLMNTLTLTIEQLNITTCFDFLEQTMIENYYFPYSITFISAFFFLPLVITVCCYFVIIKNLNSQTIVTTHKKSRSIFLCMAVLCVICSCSSGKAKVMK